MAVMCESLTDALCLLNLAYSFLCRYLDGGSGLTTRGNVYIAASPTGGVGSVTIGVSGSTTTVNSSTLSVTNALTASTVNVSVLPS